MIEHLLFIGVCCAVTWLLSNIWSNKKSQIYAVANPIAKSHESANKSEKSLSSLIDEADMLSRRGCINVNLVRMKDGSLRLLSDFQMAVQKKEIAELIYSADESTGNYTVTDAVQAAKSPPLPMAA